MDVKLKLTPEQLADILCYEANGLPRLGVPTSAEMRQTVQEFLDNMIEFRAVHWEENTSSARKAHLPTLRRWHGRITARVANRKRI